MIITLEEAKSFIKVDFDDEDDFIIELIKMAEMYLFNSTNKAFDNTNEMAKHYCKVLIKDWYEHRELIEDKNTSGKVRFTLQSIKAQLKYGD